MNRAMYIHLTSVFSLLFTIFFAGCSGPDTASGTGVGNPGITTVSILATDTSTTARSYHSRKKIAAKSEDLVEMNITEALLLAKEIRFSLTKTVEDDYSDFGRTEIDTEIVYTGSVVFNAITGTSTPGFETMHLPAGNYTGMTITLEDDSTEAPEEFNGYVVKIAGDFFYDGAGRNFSIWLNINDESQHFYSNILGSSLKTSGQDISFNLSLNATTWLQDVNLLDYLGYENGLPLNDDGSLTIDAETDKTPSSHFYKIFNRIFKHNIFSSGELSISVR